MMIALKVLGYLWSLPYGIVGLLAATLFTWLGWINVAAWRGGALHIVAAGPLAVWMRRLGWGGFTLAWTIFFWRPPNLAIIHHEERHVWQTLILGVLFLPAWLGLFLALLLWHLGRAALTGAFRKTSFGSVLSAAAARAYVDHPLERDARHAAKVKLLGGPAATPR